jgi:hypothetical protein
MHARRLAILAMFVAGPLCHGQQLTPSSPASQTTKPGDGTTSTLPNNSRTGSTTPNGSTTDTSTFGTTGTTSTTGNTASTGGLDDLLSQALKSNPDVRLAESKVREAEAELNRVRMHIMQQIVKLEIDLEEAEKKSKQGQRQFDLTLRLFRAGQASEQEREKAAADALAANSAVARLKGELPFLLGHQPRAAKNWALYNVPMIPAATVTNTGATTMSPAPVVSGPTTDRVRKALDTPIKLAYHDATLENVIADFRKAANGVNFIVNEKVKSLGIEGRKLSVDLAEPVTLGAALQWFEDQTGLKFVIREYGIVVAPPANLPPGAVGVIESWRGENPLGVPLRSPPAVLEPKSALKK